MQLKSKKLIVADEAQDTPQPLKIHKNTYHTTLLTHILKDLKAVSRSELIYSGNAIRFPLNCMAEEKRAFLSIVKVLKRHKWSFCQELPFEIKVCLGGTDNFLHVISHHMKRNLPQVKKMIIKTPGSSCLKSNRFIQDAIKTGQIHTLTTSFVLRNSVKDKHIIWFSKTLAFANLQKIDLILSQTTIGVVGIEALSRTLSSFIKLRDLKLDFEDCSNITDEAIYLLTKKLRQAPIHLERFFIILNGCSNLTKQSIRNLREAIDESNDLLKLSLEFQNCKKIDNEGLKFLVEGGLPPTLTHLSLNFASCNITDVGLETFANGLQQNLNLEYLRLKFENLNKITDEGVIKFSQGFCNSLTKLYLLDLSLADCWVLKEKSIESLIQEIGRNLISLQNLTLNFLNISHITDKVIKALIEEIGEKLSLKRFTLFLPVNCELSSKAYSALRNKFKAILELKHSNNLSQLGNFDFL